MADYAWYNKSILKALFISLRPVAQKQANAHGLFDMNGNDREWCQDGFGEYPISHVTDPTGSSWGKDKGTRGGDWC